MAQRRTVLTGSAIDSPDAPAPPTTGRIRWRTELTLLVTIVLLATGLGTSPSLPAQVEPIRLESPRAQQTGERIAEIARELCPRVLSDPADCREVKVLVDDTHGVVAGEIDLERIIDPVTMMQAGTHRAQRLRVEQITMSDDLDDLPYSDIAYIAAHEWTHVHQVRTAKDSLAYRRHQEHDRQWVTKRLTELAQQVAEPGIDDAGLPTAESVDRLSAEVTAPDGRVLATELVTDCQVLDQGLAPLNTIGVPYYFHRNLPGIAERHVRALCAGVPDWSNRDPA